MTGRSLNAGFLSPELLEEYGIQDAKQRNILIHSTCVIVNFDNLKFGSNIRIDPFVVLSCSNLVLGNYIHIATGCGIFGKIEVRLEDFSNLAAQSLIYSSNDDYSGMVLVGPTVPPRFSNVTSAPVIFERHSIVGARCVVLPGVTLAEGAAVGSGSLVRTDLPAWTISVGSPAKPIKPRARGCLEKEAELRATVV
jgi:acetyltransferase-like isoleucine patch superfamily enzyme